MAGSNAKSASLNTSCSKTMRGPASRWSELHPLEWTSWSMTFHQRNTFVEDLEKQWHHGIIGKPSSRIPTSSHIPYQDNIRFGRRPRSLAVFLASPSSACLLFCNRPLHTRSPSNTPPPLIHPRSQGTWSSRCALTAPPPRSLGIISSHLPRI
jgi:hypothetical protein